MTVKREKRGIDMQLLESWKESLRFFDRKNITLYALVTAKAIKTVYEHIVRSLGVAIVLFVLFAMIFEPRFLNGGAWMFVALRVVMDDEDGFFSLCICNCTLHR